MTMMVVATIWHVRSRQRAAAVVAALADERQRMIERERTFFANVTHDLMTPITIARGHVDILGRSGTPTPDELAETKQVIVEELKRIESMVGDLLLVGRLDDDRPPCSASASTPRSSCTSSPTAGRSSASGVWTIDIDAPGTVLVDGNTLSQALDNVIENAVSYTAAGRRDHIPGTRPSARPSKIEVIDTGLGIPQSAIPHVFDRFYRADRARSRSTGGSGLGLAIVRDVVEAHGGKVSVESPAAGGTRLTVVLPEFRR